MTSTGLHSWQRSPPHICWPRRDFEASSDLSNGSGELGLCAKRGGGKTNKPTRQKGNAPPSGGRHKAGKDPPLPGQPPGSQATLRLHHICISRLGKTRGVSTPPSPPWPISETRSSAGIIIPCMSEQIPNLTLSRHHQACTTNTCPGTAGHLCLLKCLVNTDFSLFRTAGWACRRLLASAEG